MNIDKNKCASYSHDMAKVCIMSKTESAEILPLSSNGIMYAQRLTEFCKNEDIPKKLISSTLQRAVQTASHSQQYFESWKKIPLLNEINAGDMEDLTYTEFKERFPDEYAKRKEDKFSYQVSEWRILQRLNR